LASYKNSISVLVIVADSHHLSNDLLSIK